jgi:nucleotide-binding universal stress UspA family protein
MGETKMIRRILVGLADVKYSASAIHMAIELAQAHHAALTAVGVIDEERLRATGPVPIGAGQMAKELREHRLSEARRSLEQALQYYESSCRMANVPFSVEQALGDPFRRLAELARYQDLVVCGVGHLFEHGVVKEPPDALVKLVQLGVRPLITVNGARGAVRRVLVAYSGSMESATALKRFAQMRMWPDVTLRVVTFEYPREEADRLLADAAAYCASHDYEVDTDYVAQSPISGVAQYAERWKADVVVMGNSSRNLLLSRLFGETLLDTMQRAPCPLFLAQ